jgi:hypothetical protein
VILDNELFLSNAQAITADAASTNVVDLKAAKDIGPGEGVGVVAKTVAAFATLTSLNIIIQGCTAADGTGATTILTKNFLLAALGANKALAMPSIPSGSSFRYIRAYYDVVGSDATAGSITLYLTPHALGAKTGNVNAKY